MRSRSTFPKLLAAASVASSLLAGFPIRAAAEPKLESKSEPTLTSVLAQLAQEDARRQALAASLDVTRVERDEDVDRKGRVEHAVEREVRVTHRGGQEHEELVRAARDGKDTTAELRPRFEEAQRSYREARTKQPRREELPTPNPFSAEEQGHYQFTAQPDARERGTWTVHFQPRAAQGPTAYEGEAKVQPSPGELRTLTMRPASLPTFVKSSELTLSFATTPLGPVLLQSSFEGEGGVLFFTKRYRSVVTYRDYQRPAP